MTDPTRKKRSLTHVGGATETEGSHEDSDLLAQALDVKPSTDEEDDPARTHIHGFHTYPARMHPLTAAKLVQGFCLNGGRVLDPFCGSGTVLIESLIAGRNAVGTDLNPLAVLLCRCKTKTRSSKESDHLLDLAKAIAAEADERRLAKAKPLKRYPKADLILFEPHILMELDSIRAGIESRKKDPAAADLWMVLSAILIKFSKQEGDTSSRVGPKKFAPGFPAKHFVRKTEELIRKSGEFQKLLPTDPLVIAKAWQGNALILKGLEFGPIDAIITSPPYAGTYDYTHHHTLRLRWLGLKWREFEKGEMGARGTYQAIDFKKAPLLWREELSLFLKAAAPHLGKDAPLILVIADSAIGQVALRADQVLAQIANECGFAFSARASQPRPHFHTPGQAVFRERPRMEHAIVLRRKA